MFYFFCELYIYPPFLLFHLWNAYANSHKNLQMYIDSQMHVETKKMVGDSNPQLLGNVVAPCSPGAGKKDYNL
jgi:hypothetical protein